MTGLRERKKLQTRMAIIEAALGVFAETGFEAATMEQIAARADVSVGTVYNYFGSKHILLVALFEEETDLMLKGGQKVLNDPGVDLSGAVRRLFASHLEVMSSIDPALLREVFVFGLSGREVMEDLARLDTLLIDQMGDLLRLMQGSLRPGVEPAEAALYLFGVFVIPLFMYMGMPGFDAESVQTTVDRHLEIAFQGLGPA